MTMGGVAGDLRQHICMKWISAKGLSSRERKSHKPVDLDEIMSKFDYISYQQKSDLFKVLKKRDTLFKKIMVNEQNNIAIKL